MCTQREVEGMAEREATAVDADALKGQLKSLQDQARQLSSLVGDDVQSPLLPLQVRMGVWLLPY